MKKTKKILITLIMLTCLCGKSLSFAHEIFYDSNGNGISLRWSNLQNGLPYLQINGDYLNEEYDPFFNDAAQAWGTESDDVLTTTSSFSISTVDMATTTETYWINRWGSYYAESIAGVTDIKDSTGDFIDTISAAQNSSGNIVYAQIFLSPYTNEFDDEIHMEKTMVHELGHVLCLGHPDADYYPLAQNVTSIMRRGSLGYNTPQDHDCTDLSNMY